MNALSSIAAICFSSVLALSACSGKAGGGGDRPDANTPGNPDGGDPSPDAGVDSDGDGVPDAEELERGTDPTNPDSDGDGLNDGDELQYGADPLDPDTDDDGLTDREEVDLGTNPADMGCENQNAEASRGTLPADIIIAFDNSSSMGEEAESVEKNINADLAQVLNDDNIDYRIIMLADFPPTNAENGVDPTDPNMCIQPPLTMNNCASLGSQTKSNNTERFIQYDQPIGSDDALRTIINELDDAAGDIAPAQYPGGWGQHLREGAIRIFIIITDDDSGGITIDNFRNTFVAKVQTRFPDEPTREIPFIMHSILGMASKEGGAAWLPDEPVQTTRCSPGSQDAGETYQQISIDTGGLRFPLCGVNVDENNDDIPDSDFKVVFNAIAENVINEVNLPCSFSPNPDQEDLNFDGTRLIYRPQGTGPVEGFDEVDTPEACGDASDAFYKIEGGPVPVFELCPATCDRVSEDLSGKINLIIDCEIQIG